MSSRGLLSLGASLARTTGCTYRAMPTRATELSGQLSTCFPLQEKCSRGQLAHMLDRPLNRSGTSLAGSWHRLNPYTSLWHRSGSADNSSISVWSAKPRHRLRLSCAFVCSHAQLGRQFRSPHARRQRRVLYPPVNPFALPAGS